ncbi:MAG TPA: LutB/LldF family L-lactate oxidation iron-sulfur protein [Terriglobia bacterium]|nr:LutB/LldF family L-lactate oxidation iron-sulfur protein [Terriglobia bacterium]
MVETGIQSEHIHERAEKTLHDVRLQEAYRSSTLRLYTHRLEAIGQVPGFEPLRDRARALKREVIEHLDEYLAQFADRVEGRGGKVHWAATGDEVCSIVREIAQRAGVKEFVKSKTMVGEEVELNQALEAAGIRPVETDLGELIIQLAGDRPAHIVAPAIHKTRQDVSDLFVEHLHSERTTEPERLTAIARRALRQSFVRAEMGVSGANFAVAETGTLVLVENEGNIRFCTTAPRIHVALVGIEKLIPRFDDLAVFLRLLGRSGTGQKLTVYTSLLTGPRREGEDGPDEMHVVLVDNGRIATLSDEKMREALYCIRCGACLNACPVYRKIGGHAYGWVYSGPIGALITPEFNGIGAARELPFASSLCGACREVCPVRINIPDLLLHLRTKAQDQTAITPSSGPPRGERSSMRFWAWAMKRPQAYGTGARLARLGQRLYARNGWIRKLPVFPMSGWTQGRDFPALAPQSFRDWWKKNRR